MGLGPHAGGRPQGGAIFQLARLPMVFVHETGMMIILVYMDDGLTYMNTAGAIKFAKNALRTHYEIMDPGEGPYFLGLGIMLRADEIVMSQQL